MVQLINSGIPSAIPKRKSEASGGGGGGGGRGKKRRPDPFEAHPISIGRSVAVNHGGNWILGTVRNFDQHTEHYHIEDADTSADLHGAPAGAVAATSNIFQAPTHMVKALMVKESGYFFPKETRVLALYAGTTTFYGANVVVSAKRRKEQNYMLMFDEEQDKKEVQYEYVLPFSEPLPPSA